MQNDPQGYTPYPRGPVRGRGPSVEHISTAANLFAKAPSAYLVGSLPAVGLFVTYLAISFGSSTAVNSQNMAALFTYTALLYGVGFVAYLVAYLNMAGIVRMGLRQLRGEPVSHQMVWDVGDRVSSVVAAIFLVGLASIVGAIFCILPGFIVWSLSMLTFPYITEEGLSPLGAWRRSIRELQPMFMPAVGIGSLLLIIHNLSPGFLGFGLVVGQALVGIYIACVYTSMKTEGA